MRLGVQLGGFTKGTNGVDRAVELGTEAERLGLDSVWFAQMFNYDAPALASAVGRAVPRISVGTAVVPIYPRHPQILASAAKTAQAATGGRFQLGIGLGVKDMLEPSYGLPYPPPITHLREYLGALRPLLDGAKTGYSGVTVTSHPLGPTALAGAEPAIPVVVAAADHRRARGRHRDVPGRPQGAGGTHHPRARQGSSRRRPTGTSGYRRPTRGGHR
jgi:alkanesulfonate monooxygenase SsuD/methylene tetrahydromethanopterin reductase-like flavin-dependent oxidoreductase (luciferase family)